MAVKTDADTVAVILATCSLLSIETVQLCAQSQAAGKWLVVKVPGLFDFPWFNTDPTVFMLHY